MDKKQINAILEKLADKKTQLSALEYSDENYDALEDQVHDLEDELMDKHGDDLNKIFEQIHDKFCPDEEVLLPTAYVANKYKILEGEGTKVYTVMENEGVPIELKNLPGQKVRFVLVPNPLRVMLNTKERQVDIWS